MRNYYKKKNNPIKVLTALSLVLAGLFVASKQFNKQSGNYSASHNVQDVLVAEYGDEKIFKSDIEKKINAIFEISSFNRPLITFEEIADNNVEIIAKEIFLDRKIAKKAAELNLNNDKKLIDRVEGYKSTLTRQFYIDSVVKVSDEEALELYTQKYSNKDLKKEFHILQIVLSKKTDAEKVKKLIKGNNFGQISKKYSNRKFGLENDGDIGLVREDNFMPQVKPTVLSMKIGDVSKPIEVDGLWYIIKLTEIIQPKTPTYEEVKADLIAELKKNKVNELSSGLTKNAKYRLIVKPKNDSAIPPSSPSEAKELTATDSKSESKNPNAEGGEDESESKELNDSN